MGKIIDLTDRNFGRLTAIKFSHKDKHHKAYWLCKCSCGVEKTISSASLRKNYTKSCGCLRKEMLKSDYRRALITAANRRNGMWVGKNNPGYDKKGSKNPAYRKEVREKIALSKIGDKNPAWCGGTSYEPYCEIFKIKSFREIIFDRDEYRCQNPLCNGKTKRLCIHHINYDKKECSLDNLILLCTSCNARANADREYWKSLYSQIIRDKVFTNKR